MAIMAAKMLRPKAIVGIDISEKMLEVAKRDSSDRICYVHSAVEDASFENSRFDLITSSLVFHYIEDFPLLCKKLFAWLNPGGHLVFSIEHPMCTAYPEERWIRNGNEEVLYWPVNNYHFEGRRVTTWFVDNVIKYHRTTETYVNTLIDTGLQIVRLSEPTVPEKSIQLRPELYLQKKRPPFLLLSATKKIRPDDA